MESQIGKQDGTISRKQFLQTTASAAAGLFAIRIGKGQSALGMPPEVHNSHIERLVPIIRLYGTEAEVSGSAQLDSIKSALQWLGSGSATWRVSIPEPGSYEVALCYSATLAGARVELRAGGSSIVSGLRKTEGFFLTDAPVYTFDPPTVKFYNFERVRLNGALTLPRGANVVTMHVEGRKGDEILRLRSVELIPAVEMDAIVHDQDLARAGRASTDWLVRAGYGVMFHWTSWTQPRKGLKKPYSDAAEAFDVNSFAALLEEIGAGYVLFTVNHADPHCPAPLRSWEEIHPGWTTRRDLIGDLADALNRRGIKLLLYINSPTLGKLAQIKGTVIDRPTVSEEEFVDIHYNVLTEIGLRYREGVAGYWFDSWFQSLAAYPNVPFKKLFEACKAGNPSRIIAYNFWAFPVCTEWQEYWSGELFSPQKFPTHRYIQRGAGEGLQFHALVALDAPWYHDKRDAEMEPPRFSEEVLIRYVTGCMQQQGAVTINLGIFQDGTIGEASRQTMHALRRAVRRA